MKESMNSRLHCDNSGGQINNNFVFGTPVSERFYSTKGTLPYTS